MLIYSRGTKEQVPPMGGPHKILFFFPGTEDDVSFELERQFASKVNPYFLEKNIRATTRENGPYDIGDQQRLRRVCA